MIAYDFKCDQGHVFEGWFEGWQAFEDQKTKGLISCPVCGSLNIERMLSTFGIAKHRRQETSVNHEAQLLEKLIHYVEDNFEDVGSEFAKEALKMHYGVSDPRNIRGVSSAQEEQTLREEGISFFKLPVLQNSDSEEEN